MPALATAQVKWRPPNGQPFGQRGHNGSVTITRTVEWQSWVELSVRVQPLPADITTKELYDAFSSEGHVTIIDIFREGQDVSARLRFR